MQNQVVTNSRHLRQIDKKPLPHNPLLGQETLCRAFIADYSQTLLTERSLKCKNPFLILVHRFERTISQQITVFLRLTEARSKRL